jgi:hypothetical protein
MEFDEEEKNENEILVFNSLTDFVNKTNEIYPEQIAKSIRNSTSQYNLIKGCYDFTYWTHNGNRFKEPTHIEFNKTLADKDFAPLFQLIEDEKNGILHEEPVDFIEEIEKMIQEENEKCGISFDDVYLEETESNDFTNVSNQRNCNCKK